MIQQLSRPFRPVELGPDAPVAFQLEALAADLRAGEEFQRSGVAAVTLVRDEPMTLVLIALRKGEAMREHSAPSAATVVVLAGHIAFVAGASRTELVPGTAIAFSAELPHAVEALEDAVYLVSIGGRSRAGGPS
ncbi:MAG: cupin domain-containing protein [Myxococcota bacterium]|jgi:quercetin dioxygenase-like cupin family protein|nr:cupin domain-containing protein [Myxococcota bacterium]